MELDKCGF